MRYQIFSKRSKSMRRPSKIWVACCLTYAALLQGCAATSPACLHGSNARTEPPSPSTPQPAQLYSKQWQQEVSDWQSVVQTSRQS